MVEFEKFTLEDIIIALKFDIKHYKRKYDYHRGIAQVYIERIKEIEEKILKIRQNLPKKQRVD